MALHSQLHGRRSGWPLVSFEGEIQAPQDMPRRGKKAAPLRDEVVGVCRVLFDQLDLHRQHPNLARPFDGVIRHVCVYERGTIESPRQPLYGMGS